MTQEERVANILAQVAKGLIADYPEEADTIQKRVAEKLVANFNQIRNLDKQYEELYEELVATLLSLKTYAHVQNQLPEAAQFLPQVQNRFLPSNITSLKSKLAELV